MQFQDRRYLLQYLINNLKAQSYLEIGIREGFAWNSISAPEKISVDINPVWKPTFCMSSDQFFQENKRFFDIIFIDGLHEKSQVLKDITNALQCLSHKGVIITHDTLPRTRYHVSDGQCWNAWEAFAYLRKTRPDLYMASLNTDEIETGCGIIIKGDQKLFEPEITNLDFDYYDRNRISLMNVLTIEEIMPHLIKESKSFGHILLTDSGFFSSYLLAISSAWACRENGLIPYIDSSKTFWSQNGENPWNLWFEQDFPSKTDTFTEMPISKWIFEHTVPACKQKLDKISEAAKLYGKPHKHLIDSAKNFVKNELNNEPFLGVQSRTTEMNVFHPQYGINTGDDFSRMTKFVMEKYPNLKKMFLVSEDNDVIKLFESNYPNNLKYLKNVFRGTDKDISDRWNWWIYNDRPNHKKKLGEECIIQTLILSKCENFIYKQSGISSTAVIWANGNIKEHYYVHGKDDVDVITHPPTRNQNCFL